ncbi:MAG: HAD-IA family hydrolase [Microvirga sp.]
MKLVIFDVDGTLVDSQTIIVAAQRAAFASLGLEPPSRERSLSIVGLSLIEAFTVLAGPKAPVEALTEAYKTAFGTLRLDPAYEEPFYPGALECLDWLSAQDGVRLGLATGKTRRGVSHLLERHGWDRRFATIQTADDAPSKPHPAMIRQALAATGVQAENAVMIGDSTFDMQMAKAAGIGAVGVAWGFHPPAALREAGADVITASYAALMPLLRDFLDPTSQGALSAPISCP